MNAIEDARRIAIGLSFFFDSMMKKTKKIKVVTITLDSISLILKSEDLQEWFEEIDYDSEDKYTIQFGTMSLEEFDNLDEFDGF